jgi:hypothetical protein
MEGLIETNFPADNHRVELQTGFYCQLELFVGLTLLMVDKASAHAIHLYVENVYPMRKVPYHYP